MNARTVQECRLSCKSVGSQCGCRLSGCCNPSSWTGRNDWGMSRLLALPLTAIIMGILACGASATEVPATSAPASEAATGRSSKTASPSSALSSPTDAPTSTALPDSAAVPTLAPLSTALPEPASAPTEAPARAAVIVDQPEVGTGVGKTVPHFEFTLAGGAKRSTAQLSRQGRPVFLFFFTPW